MLPNPQNLKVGDLVYLNCEQWEFYTIKSFTHSGYLVLEMNGEELKENFRPTDVTYAGKPNA